MKKMANVCVVCISKPLPGSRSSNCILLQLHITKAPSVHLYMLLHSGIQNAFNSPVDSLFCGISEEVRGYLSFGTKAGRRMRELKLNFPMMSLLVKLGTI
jgi:hypothetical protein